MPEVEVEAEVEVEVEWFHRAAINGCKQSIQYLVNCYQKGYGVLKDDNIAQEWQLKYDDANNNEVMA